MISAKTTRLSMRGPHYARNLLRIASVVAFSMVTVGCAVTKETFMADGRKGYSISCDGAAVGINVCFEKAWEICEKRGYDLIGRDGAIVPTAYATADRQSLFVYSGSFYTKSIRIACK